MTTIILIRYIRTNDARIEYKVAQKEVPQDKAHSHAKSVSEMLRLHGFEGRVVIMSHDMHPVLKYEVSQ